MGLPTPVTPPDKRVQVKIEVGHQAISKENPTSLFTHEWTTFVRGADGADISHFVERVVFHLHESFPKPKRVCKEPPFKVSEQGYGSFTLPIEIYFRNKEEPRKYSVNYELTLQLRGLPPLNCTKVEALTFLNPSDEFEQKLLSGGAVLLTPGISSDAQKSKTDKIASPASSHGSPNPQKKASSALTPKVKKESQLSHSNKRPNISDDVGLKPKKKKISDKHEHANIASTLSNSLLKEISILTPGNESETSKGKTSNIGKKPRRNSTDENTPKASTKESKHNGKDGRVKKDKKKISPGGTGENIIPKIKFTLKRQDESWSAAQINLDNLAAQTATAMSSTILENNVTTATQQNDHVKKVMAEFAQQQGNSSDDNMIASPDHNDIGRSAHRTTPDDLLSSSISSVDSARGGGTSSKKKSKISKSHNTNNKTKGNRDLDKKSRSETPRSFNSATTILTAQELTDLFKKLNELQDSDILQGVVDIVETSGQYDITSSTFDFDLCTLEAETISAIKHFLDKT